MTRGGELIFMLVSDVVRKGWLPVLLWHVMHRKLLNCRLRKSCWKKSRSGSVGKYCSGGTRHERLMSRRRAGRSEEESSAREPSGRQQR